MVYLTRREHFNAAHRLYVPHWSAERNQAVFGPCANEHFHGHNFELFVTVKGEPDPDTGFILNAKELGRLIREQIVARYDHRNLNLDLDDFDGIQPSTENFVKVIWKRLEPHLPPGTLYRVRLCETENIFAEYFGE
jgi:6-pyruvoyltetrahydropterin/6-carboxytetrahydropterin synthase